MEEYSELLIVMISLDISIKPCKWILDNLKNFLKIILNYYVLQKMLK